MTQSVGTVVFKVMAATLILIAAGIPWARADASPEATRLADTAVFKGDFDEVLYEVGQVHPRFAGFWVDEAAGTTTVLLAEGGDEAAAEAVVELLAAAFDDPTFLERRVVVRADADYSFAQLFEWFRSVRVDVGSVPGMVMSGIDERRNRISFGVEDLSVEDEIDELLRDRGVPADAVIVEEQAPIRRDLGDRHRPVVGGLQIENNTLWICTLGFVAYRGGVPGFVTNSHCTNTQGGTESTLFGQPFTEWHIGQEQVDPPLFSDAASGCPSGRMCRESDAAWAEFAPALPSGVVDHARGEIARPAGGRFGDPTWGGVSTYRITSEGPGPGLDTTVYKVGRTTGRTRGTVTDTCIDIWVVDTSITILCETVADYNSDSGDSGSAVFRIMSGTDVRLVGLHWGFLTDGTGAIFSPFGTPSGQDVQGELGSLGTCAPGFGC